MINKTDKLVPRLTEEKEFKHIKSETKQRHYNDTTEIQRIVRDDYEQPYNYQIGNLGMDKLLETCSLPRLNHVEIENMKRLIMSKEIKSVKAKTTQQRKAQDQMV